MKPSIFGMLAVAVYTFIAFGGRYESDGAKVAKFKPDCECYKDIFEYYDATECPYCPEPPPPANCCCTAIATAEAEAVAISAACAQASANASARASASASAQAAAAALAASFAGAYVEATLQDQQNQGLMASAFVKAADQARELAEMLVDVAKAADANAKAAVHVASASKTYSLSASKAVSIADAQAEASVNASRQAEVMAVAAARATHNSSAVASSCDTEDDHYMYD